MPPPEAPANLELATPPKKDRRFLLSQEQLKPVAATLTAFLAAAKMYRDLQPQGGQPGQMEVTLLSVMKQMMWKIEGLVGDQTLFEWSERKQAAIDAGKSPDDLMRTPDGRRQWQEWIKQEQAKQEGRGGAKKRSQGNTRAPGRLRLIRKPGQAAAIKRRPGPRDISTTGEFSEGTTQTADISA